MLLVYRDNDAMFTNQISTDGYAVHFQLARAAKKASIDLKLEDFSMSEIEEYFSVCSIDPGRKHVFTASYGYGEDEHEIRRVSRKEYSAFIGSKNRTRALQKMKKANGIEQIESRFPTCKTASVNIYNEYVAYTFQHMDILFAFYSSQHAKTRFQNLQGRQRAQEELANIIINGGKKYNAEKRKNRSKNRKKRKKYRQKRKKYKQYKHCGR